MNLRMVVALLLVGCGPAPVNNGTGGGSSGTGGGSGGGSAGGGAEAPTVNLTIDNCPSLSPCGGSPLPGTWFYTAGCVTNPFRGAQQACGAITFSNLQATVKGRVTFDATTVTRRVETSVSGTINVPASCLMGVLTCAQMQTQLRQTHPTATCAAAGGGCDCAVTDNELINDASAYSASGNTLTVGSGMYDYCLAPASTVKYRRTDSATVEDGLMTLTRQ